VKQLLRDVPPDTGGVEGPGMGEIGVRVAGVLVAGGKVLLARHRKRGRSYWVLPGGRVKFQETLREALGREMHEELGLDVTVGPLIIVHDFVRGRRHRVNLVFRVEAAAKDFRVSRGRVLRDARWVDLSGLDGIDFLPPIAKHLRSVLRRPQAKTLYLGNV